MFRRLVRFCRRLMPQTSHSIANPYGLTIVVRDNSCFPDGRPGLRKHLLGIPAGKDRDTALLSLVAHRLQYMRVDVTAAVEKDARIEDE